MILPNFVAHPHDLRHLANRVDPDDVRTGKDGSGDRGTRVSLANRGAIVQLGRRPRSRGSFMVGRFVRSLVSAGLILGLGLVSLDASAAVLIASSPGNSSPS